MATSWKRELGVVAILTIGAVAYRVYSNYAGPEFDEGLQKLEADVKRTLPKKVDEITTLEDVKYERTKTSYWFTIDAQAKPFDSNLIEQRVRDTVCANTEVARTMNERGFTYEYHYLNKERLPLAVFTLTQCP